jgi:hypothetical protein
LGLGDVGRDPPRLKENLINHQISFGYAFA